MDIIQSIVLVLIIVNTLILYRQVENAKDRIKMLEYKMDLYKNQVELVPSSTALLKNLNRKIRTQRI